MCLGSPDKYGDASDASMGKNPWLYIQLLQPLLLIEFVEFLNEVIITY